MPVGGLLHGVENMLYGKDLGNIVGCGGVRKICDKNLLHNVLRYACHHFSGLCKHGGWAEAIGAAAPQAENVVFRGGPSRGSPCE